MEKNYKIIRFYQSFMKSNKIIKTGLSKKDALKHCNDIQTSSSTCTNEDGIKHTKKNGHWFDGFIEVQK
jgi:hypothetical protein